MFSEFPFHTHVNLTRSGLEAIIQDEFSASLDSAPDCQKYSLNKVLWRFLSTKLHLRIVFIGLLLIRFVFIFPIRVLIYISSFVFLAICCVLTYFIHFSIEQKVFITRRYCRLYTAGSFFSYFIFYKFKRYRNRISRILLWTREQIETARNCGFKSSKCQWRNDPCFGRRKGTALFVYSYWTTALGRYWFYSESRFCKLVIRIINYLF